MDALKWYLAQKWYSQGMGYIRRGKYASALQCFEKAVDINEDYADAWNSMGAVHQSFDDYKAALQCYETALALDPKLAIAWNNKGDAHHALGDHKKALQCYKKALALNSKDVVTWRGKGGAHLDLDDYEEALVCFDEALALNSGDAIMWSSKGKAHFGIDDHEDALECFEKALDLDEDYADAWNAKGTLHSVLDDLKDALECFGKALDLDPKLALAWNNKGHAHDELGQPNKALVCFDEALRLDEELAASWNGKGNAHTELSQPDEAHRAYRKSIHLDPTYPGVWYNVGLLYRDLFDDPARAQSAFVRSIHLASTQGKLVADALRKLQSMGAAPLLVARTYREHHALDLLLREPKGYAEAFARCERFYEWSALFARDSSLPETFRLAVLGLEALALGDPISAETLFTALVEANPESLFAHYYLARSRSAYHEIGAAEEGLGVARSLVRDVMRQAVGAGRSPGAEQLYYAGLILSMDLSGSIVGGESPQPESYQAARLCLEAAVKRGWHPARFALVDVLNELKDSKASVAAIDDLLAAERALYENGRLGFLRGVPHSRLSFDRLVETAADPETETYDDAGYPSIGSHDPWELPGRAQATYIEITDALPFVYDWLHGPDKEPRDLPEKYAFVDRHADVDPTAYREGWHQWDRQSAATEARRETVTAQEIDELREQLADDVQEPFWEDWFDPDEPSDHDAARLEKQLGYDIQNDTTGERADTHLKLIRYLLLQDEIPARTATLLAAYYASCRADETRYDRSSKASRLFVEQGLTGILGIAISFLPFASGLVGVLIDLASGATASYRLMPLIAARLVHSLEGPCTYPEFKIHFYERLRALRSDQQERLEKQGLWDSSIEAEMKRVAV